MATWLRYLSRQDIAKARLLAGEQAKSEIVEMATAHVRKETLFSGIYIPLACIFSFAVACSLYVPDLWPSRLYGGFIAIASMMLPILVVLRAQKVQQKGRIIALAYYIIEYQEGKTVDEKKTSS